MYQTFKRPLISCQLFFFRQCTKQQGDSIRVNFQLLLPSRRLLAASGGVQREGLGQRRPLLDGGGERHPQRPADRPGEIRALRDPGSGFHTDR